MHDSPAHPLSQLFVGVDIAAVTATVAWQAPQQKPSKPIIIEQTPEGFSSLHQRLMKMGTKPDQILIVLEAPGVYWLSLAPFFARQGYALSVVNPTQAHCDLTSKLAHWQVLLSKIHATTRYICYYYVLSLYFWQLYGSDTGLVISSSVNKI